MYASIVKPKKSTCSWPRIYYDKVDELVRSIHAKTILEVGVAYGYHAEHLLDTHKDLQSYIGIDPYISQYDAKDIFCSDVHKMFKGVSVQDSMDKLYTAVDEMLQSKKAAGKETVLHRSTSTEVAKNLANDSIDFIFVDGSHLYQDVLLDLHTLWPKVSKGGILCGDDFKTWPDVARAVKEFSDRETIPYQLEYQADYPIYVFRK
jgi:predicted O-methyltransferase YrrM